MAYINHLMSLYAPLQIFSSSVLWPQLFAKPFPSYLLVFYPLLGLPTFLASPPLWASPCLRSTKGGQEIRNNPRNSEPPQSLTAMEQFSFCLWGVRQSAVHGRAPNVSAILLLGNLNVCNKCHSLQCPAVRGAWQRARKGGCKTSKCFWQQVVV